jgi:hypothetical protein
MSSAPSPKIPWKTDLREQKVLGTSLVTEAWLHNMETAIIKEVRRPLNINSGR